MNIQNKPYFIKLLRLLFFACNTLVFTFYAKAQESNFSNVPGTVIAYRPAADKVYLGSPSICILPDGTYLVSHDFFGKSDNIVSVYESRDKGQSWNKISEFPGFWSGLFLHKNELYLMGVDESRNAVIRKSTDGGHTWTSPVDTKTGLIRAGDVEKGYHTSAVSIMEANDRLWRPYEVAPRRGGWGNFEAVVFSISSNADLLDAANWTTSTRMAVDTAWGTEYNTWLEGGAVISRDGHVLNILRVDDREEEHAAIIHVADDGRNLSFQPERDFIRFPGGCKRFVIRYDAKSDRYWSIANWVPDEFKGYNIERSRNTQALVSSPDLQSWTVHSVVLQDDNIEKSGFQYVDWLVEDDDIIFVSRTAFFDGKTYADNQHNSNFITFHRIENFREQVAKELVTITND